MGFREDLQNLSPGGVMQESATIASRLRTQLHETGNFHNSFASLIDLGQALAQVLGLPQEEATLVSFFFANHQAIFYEKLPVHVLVGAETKNALPTDILLRMQAMRRETPSATKQQLYVWSDACLKVGIAMSTQLATTHCPESILPNSIRKLSETDYFTNTTDISGKLAWKSGIRDFTNTLRAN